MKLLFFLLIIGIIYVLYVIAKLPKEDKSKKLRIATEYDIANENDVEADLIRDEIRAEVKKHAPAVTVLQALSRLDGTASKAEQNLIFEFMSRNGGVLSYERHRPHFSDSVSGEWNYAAEIDDFKRIIIPLASMTLPYRIDVFATAQAIVAVGGAPRKREAEALDLLRDLIRERDTEPVGGDGEYEGNVYILGK